MARRNSTRQRKTSWKLMQLQQLPVSKFLRVLEGAHSGQFHILPMHYR